MYTAPILIGYLNGFGAAVEPWIPIPAERYYFWELFFAGPVFALVVILASGVTRGLGGMGVEVNHRTRWAMILKMLGRDGRGVGTPHPGQRTTTSYSQPRSSRLKWRRRVSSEL